MGDKGQYTVDSLPFFMKTVSRLAITNDYPSYMSFPKEFADQQAGKMNKDVILKVSGNKWTVKVGPVKNGTIAFRGVGWTKFVKDNKLAVGDQVTFTMLSGTLFSVKIVRAEGEVVNNTPTIKVKEEPMEEAGDSVPYYKPEERNEPVDDEVDLSSPQVEKDLGAPPTPPPPPPPPEPPITTVKENAGSGNFENGNITIQNFRGTGNETPLKRPAEVPPEETPPPQRMRKRVSMTPASDSRQYATRGRGSRAPLPREDEAVANRTRSAAKQAPARTEENEEVGGQETHEEPTIVQIEERRPGTEKEPFVLDLSGAKKEGGVHILMKTEKDKAYRLFISASVVEEMAEVAAVSCRPTEIPASSLRRPPETPPAAPQRPQETPAGSQRPPETPTGSQRPSETTPARSQRPSETPPPARSERPAETPARSAETPVRSERPSEAPAAPAAPAAPERPLETPRTSLPPEPPVETPASDRSRSLAPNGPLPRITVPIKTTTVQSYSRLAIDKGFADKWLPHESCSIKVVDAKGTTWSMNWVESEKRLRTEGWEKLAKHYNLQIGDVCLLELLDSVNFRISFVDSGGRPKPVP